MAMEQVRVVMMVVALVVGLVVADAAAVVEVYRMIQYDLRGMPLGSRRAALNHHASSSLSRPGSDLSRTVVILPITKLNTTILNGNLFPSPSSSLCCASPPAGTECSSFG